MICVRCGTRLKVGNFVCEHCGTTIGVNENALKSVKADKLATGDIIFFTSERQSNNYFIPSNISQAEAAPLHEINNKQQPGYIPKTDYVAADDTDTRKTIFKYLTESKDRLSEVKHITKEENKVGYSKSEVPFTAVDAASDKKPEVISAFAEAESLKIPSHDFSDSNEFHSEDEAEDFWDNIDEVESGLRTAAENIIITSESEYPQNSEIFSSDDEEIPAKESIKAKSEPSDSEKAADASANKKSELTPESGELLYRTEYKLSDEARASLGYKDNDLKAPLGAKPVSQEVLALFSSPKEKSMTAGEWLGTILLLLLPGVNLVLLIIWAMGGCKKKQKILFARALLIIFIVLIFAAASVYFIFLRNIIKLDMSLIFSSGDQIIKFFNEIITRIRFILKF